MKYANKLLNYIATMENKTNVYRVIDLCIKFANGHKDM